MKNFYLTGISLVTWLLFTFNNYAESSMTLELTVPYAITFETGVVSDSNTYLSAKLQLSDEKSFGGEVTWVKARNETEKHWWGGGVGYSKDDQSDFISFELGTYLSLNYKYYAKGIRENGFHFNGAIRVTEGGVLPVLGFGYNF